MMLFQFLVIGLFIIFSVISIVNGEGTGTFFTATPFFNGDVPFSLVFAGAAIACYSFLGFDAVSTLSEETIDAEKTIPRAIFLVALIGGIIFVSCSYFIYLVFPDYSKFLNSDAAGVEIARFVGGNIFSAIFLAGIITAQFASGLSAQASASRMLYALLPLIGACLDIWLLSNLDIHALVLGGIWAVCGLIYLLFLTKAFSKEPPELSFSEAEKGA
ncbi:APC family permease [Aneurinibacillus sp. BA2021]|nr:APC family permease [Aneurinibacillus sp. BA2021]